MALSLTFVNQIGAPNGINQAAPGSFIPESFIRWAQDVLFDRVGYLRRRAPFKVFPLYNNAVVPILTYPSIVDERIISVVSTINPIGDKVTSILLTTNNPSKTIVGTSRALFYNETFRNTGTSNLGVALPKDSIFDTKQAANGGMWLSFLSSYKAADSSNPYYQYYWHGGAGVEKTLNNARFGVKHTANIKHRTFTNKIYAPLFTVTNKELLNNVAILTTSAPHTVVLGDTITVSGVDSTFNTTSAIVTGVTSTTISYAKVATNVASTASTGTVLQQFNTDEITSGMFILVEYSSNNYYTGMVKTITTSEITLEKDAVRWVPDTPIASFSAGWNSIIMADANGAIWAGSPGDPEYLQGVKIKFRNFRPYIHLHGRGLITRDSTSATGVVSGSVGTEGEGHFQSANLGPSSAGVIRWALHRASDNEWIGDIHSVTNNTTLVLDTDHHTHEADTVMRADEYVCWPYAILPSPSITNASSTDFAGIFNATYAGYQWFGNAGNMTDKNRIVFSSYHNSEAVDLSKDAADSILIPGISEMRGLATSSAGLIIFTADKTFILRGNYRANFSLEELYPEGCLSSMSIVEYGGGVFWASRIGIMFYDGASVRNLTEDNLGVYYTDSVRTFDVNADRIYAFLHKDYLFMHFNAFDSAFKPVKYEPVYADGISTTPAIANFQSQDWDPDFSVEDFRIENNVPIYWDYIQLYKATGTNTVNIVPKWGAIGTEYRWGSPGTQYVWGPAQKSQGITFAIYLPTNALTTISNFDFRGSTKIDSSSGIKALVGVNVVNPTFNILEKELNANVATLYLSGIGISVGASITVTGVDSVFNGTYVVTAVSNNAVSYAKTASNITRTATAGIVTVKGAGADDGIYARLIDVDSMLEISNKQNDTLDDFLIENPEKEAVMYIKGPDFYLQTKHYTVGDPVVKKWFRQIMLNLYLLDGGLRMDVVDLEDNDRVDVQKKRRTNWELFGEAGYSWEEVETILLPKLLSPNRSIWEEVELLNLSWYDITDAEFTRRKKKISWRYPSAGFRLYQMNNYRPSGYQYSQRPHAIMLDSWNIGFKPMRQSRV